MKRPYLVLFAFFMLACATGKSAGITDTPGSKILMTPWGSYRQSAATSKAMKAQFQDFRATKILDTPVFRQTNILRKHPHDANARTEGMVFDITYPYVIEVTGGYDASSVRRVNFLTGDIVASRVFPHKGLYWYDGVAVVGNSIYVGTRNTNSIFVYDKKTFEPKKINGREDNSFVLPSTSAAETFGLASNNFDKIYVADGSSRIYVYDNFLAYKETIKVRDGQTPIRDINSITYINGILYANINGRNSIAKILPETGDVVAWLVFDVQSLYRYNPNPWRNMLNGVAYNPFNSTLLISGLHWPFTFEIKENSAERQKNVTRKWVQDNCWSPRKAYRSMLAKYEKNDQKAVINIPHDKLTQYRESKEHANEAYRAQADRLKNDGSFVSGIHSWNVEDHRFYDFNGKLIQPGVGKYIPGGYFNRYPERRPTYEGMRNLRGGRV